MNNPATIIDAAPKGNDRLAVLQNLFINVSTPLINHHVISIAEKLEEYSLRFDHNLAVNVRVPLGHISLATQLLESLSTDIELKMCLDVIIRNSTRINNLVDEFYKFLLIEELKAEKLYINQFHIKACIG